MKKNSAFGWKNSISRQPARDLFLHPPQTGAYSEGELGLTPSRISATLPGQIAFYSPFVTN